MRDEEIFNQNPYEVYDTFKNNRFLFAIARKCHLYQYEKLIGINFSVYFDHIDEESIRLLPFIYTGEVDEMGDNDVYLDVQVKAWNFSTGKFVTLPRCYFSIRAKEWVTSELKLTSDYIDSDSSVIVKFKYSICRSKYYLGGFLKRKKLVDTYSVENKNEFQLNTVISKTDRNENFNQRSEDECDDDLDYLLRQRGVK